ncbi:MAG: hypothetical protein VR65_07790 [Desulfobulbaceae bacterium BRH_c16a]|nr:MAG: hypothetical protein VR65_07790 [Desulfobulbaceae bacterium BRH_c16a]
MKKMARILVLVSCMAVLTLLGVNDVSAATGKCVVTGKDGNKMVIECTEETKGFEKGAEIKIKTDKKKPEKGR